MFKQLLMVISLLFWMTGCGDSVKQSDTQKVKTKQVYTVNYPLYYLTQRMAPEGIKVVFPVPKGTDPAFWQPDTDEILSFVYADLIILNGADYAKWISKASLPDSRMVNTAKTFEADLIHTDGAKHTHGPTGKHSHTGTAFTVWLDMQQAIKQSEAIKNALITLEPKQKEYIEQAYIKLKSELNALDEAFKSAVTDREKPMVASHPVYQYLARRYGINLKALYWEPEMSIDKKAQDNLTTLIREHPAKVMIWEGKPQKESIELLQSMGLKSVVIEPCMNRPETGDFLSVMRNNVKQLKNAYQ